MAQLINTITEAIDMVSEKIEDKAGELGIAYVGAYDEVRIPKYPAVVIIPGDRNKVLHGENTFNILLVLELYVYHANLTMNKRERSKADLKLVDDLEALLEEDYGWQSDPLDTDTKRLIFGYVADIEPGNLQPRNRKSNLVIGTRMVWRGISQRRLKIG